MSPTLSKQEIARQIKEIRANINVSKNAIKSEFRSFYKVSRAFAKATADYKKAKAAYDKKPKAKQERMLDATLDRFYKANDDYKEVYKLIDSYYNSIEQDYNEICDLLDMRGSERKMEKVSLEFERYKDWLEKKLSDISQGVPDLVEDEKEEAPVEEAPVEEAPAPVAEPAPAPAAPAPASNSITVSPVSINPVILDVSSIVENAVDNTMAKFTLYMDKKLREYFDNLVLPEPPAAATTVVREVVKEVVAEPVAAPAPVEVNTEEVAATVELQGEVLAKEQELFEKLKAPQCLKGTSKRKAPLM